MYQVFQPTYVPSLSATISKCVFVSVTMPCGDVDLNERLDAFIRDVKQG